MSAQLYRVVSYVRRLNQLYGLNLTHYDINFMYAIRRNFKYRYYLQTRNTMVKLIFCLPDSYRNSAGEFMKVSRNWLNDELVVHYDGQLRASHLILGCVPSYTSYQNSPSALTVGSSLLSYLDMRLPRFLPHGLTSKETRHLMPKIFRVDSLELVL